MEDQNQKPKQEVKPESLPEPAGPQPPEPAGPQPPEPVVSSTTRLQETIERAAEQAAARGKITESVTDKRKQAAAMREAAMRKKQLVDRGVLDAEPAALEDQAALEPGPAALEADQFAAGRAEAGQAANEAAEAVQAANDISAPDVAEMSLDELMNFGLKQAMGLLEILKKDMRARELREIEMHNSQMDAMLQVTNGMTDIKEVLENICNLLGDMITAITNHP